ncbi:hypothetical protein RI367_007796 [Sorochytrium milnesiophthora]
MSNDCQSVIDAYTVFANGGKLDGANASSCCNQAGITCDGNNQVTKIDWSSQKLSNTAGFAKLTPLTSLTTLLLHNNTLAGPIPEEVYTLTTLTELHLSLNPLNGVLSGRIGALRNLEYLWMNGASLTGEIPSELYGLTNLLNLALQDNFLAGSIPPSISNLAKLQVLWLGNNNFEGPIPSEIYSLSSLQTLFLGDNLLTGQVSSAIGNLQQLQMLTLNRNNLTGSIPDELYALKNMQYLFLENNQFSGALSPKVGQLRQLAYLNVSNSGLTGEVPSSLGALPFESGSCDLGTQFTCRDLGFINMSNPCWDQAGKLPICSLTAFSFPNLYMGIGIAAGVAVLVMAVLVVRYRTQTRRTVGAIATKQPQPTPLPELTSVTAGQLPIPELLVLDPAMQQQPIVLDSGPRQPQTAPELLVLDTKDQQMPMNTLLVLDTNHPFEHPIYSAHENLPLNDPPQPEAHTEDVEPQPSPESLADNGTLASTLNSEALIK